jgi:hypothetical protein
LHHTGYVAVVSSSDVSSAQEIVLYAPGISAPSKRLSIRQCCVVDLAFDSHGALIAADDHEGLLRFAPGASEPTVLEKLPAFVVVTGAADAYAAAVRQYSAGGDLQARVIVRGHGDSREFNFNPGVQEIAFSRTGEVAISDASSSAVYTFAPGTTKPSRMLPIAGPPTPQPTSGAISLVGGGSDNAHLTAPIAYDINGILAVEDPVTRLIRLYSPAATSPKRTLQAQSNFGLVFSSSGSLYSINPSSVIRFDADSELPQTVFAQGMTSVASGSDGTMIYGNQFAKAIVRVDSAGKITVTTGVPIAPATGIAISP